MAYLVAILLGAIWVISKGQWMICLYAAGVFIVIGMAELFILRLLYGYDDPFKEPTEQISEETLDMLRSIIDRLEDDE